MEKRKNSSVLILLVLLTISTAYFSVHFEKIAYVILLLSGIKFLLVAFQFMELKKSHLFWKILIVLFLVFFFGIQASVL